MFAATCTILVVRPAENLERNARKMMYVSTVAWLVKDTPRTKENQMQYFTLTV